MSYAFFANGSALERPAVLSSVHELRRRYNEQPETERRVYSREDYENLLDRQVARINRMAARGDITEARRVSILERMEEARSETPDQSLMYALHNLTPTVRQRVENVRLFVNEVAARRRIPAAQAQAEFDRLVGEAVRSRNGADSPTFTPENRELANRYGLGRDVGLVHATAIMMEGARVTESRRIDTAPPRFVREPLNAQNQETGIDGLTLTEYGYDPRNGHLEVVIHDAATNTDSVCSYRNVPPYLANQMSPTSWRGAGRTWASYLRGETHYFYPDEEAEAAGAAAPNCTTCGQFAAVGHACPNSEAARRLERYQCSSRWSRQRHTVARTLPSGSTFELEVAVELPAIREFRTAFAAGPVTVPAVQVYFNDRNIFAEDPHEIGRSYNSVQVSGDLTAFRDAEEAMQVNTSQLQCNCATYRQNGDCPHIGVVADAVRTRLNPPPRTPAQARTPEERAEMLRQQQARAEEAAKSDWTRHQDTMEEARRTWRKNQEVSYFENFEAFETDYNAALAARAANNDVPVVPYMRENALGGWCQPGSGQAFAPELEYEFPSTMPYHEREAANRRIAQELFAAGLTWSNQQEGYHASKRRGFRDTHVDENGVGNWTLERDGSVNGGELVPPAMYDTPETWAKLELALDIIKRNGGVATKKTGCHVHVGTGQYGGSPEAYTELGRMVTQNEDVLYRLATDPTRGKHRNNGSGYSAPNQEVPESGFSDVSAAKMWQRGRYRALNLEGVQGGSSDHPEFRLFDGTLDAGTIQAQIKLSVALTQAADRIAKEGGTKRKKEELGAHATRAKVRGRRRMTSEDLKEDSATYRSFMDTLFVRAADKKQLTAVFANAKWTAGPRRS